MAQLEVTMWLLRAAHDDGAMDPEFAQLDDSPAIIDPTTGRSWRISLVRA
jgi:hypothetical protein